MLRTIHFLLLFFIFQTVHAQQLQVSSNYSALQGRASEEISPAVLLKNNSNSTLELRWERTKSNLPEGWDAIVCDKQCYSTLVESRNFNLSPGETISDFRVSFRPNGHEGIGNVEIKIYEIKRPSNSVTVSFNSSATINNVGSFSNSTAPTVYPNPAVDFISIQDDGNQVKYIEIFNVVGRKVLEFTKGNNGKYDIGDLPRGMYMVRLLDKNKNIIKTQRISKYNP